MPGALQALPRGQAMRPQHGPLLVGQTVFIRWVAHVPCQGLEEIPERIPVSPSSRSRGALARLHPGGSQVAVLGLPKPRPVRAVSPD